MGRAPRVAVARWGVKVRELCPPARSVRKGAGLDTWRTASSAGIGFSWIGARQWQAQVQLAAPLGAAPDVPGKRNDGRLWLQVAKGF